MRIGLIDVDFHNFPNLALMKLSAWHKAQGDAVEWWWGFGRYDRVYMSKVFTFTPDIPAPLNAVEIVKGGTGYGLDNTLPEEAEHSCPDYSLLLEWWSGQRNIVLMDPNLLACPDHMELLGQLAESGARVDINQGLDCRLLNEDMIGMINRLRLKDIHFAWDSMRESESVLRGLKLYASLAARKPHGQFGTVYCLVNYNTTMEENLHRIDTLRDMGYDPYVMIYDKPNAPREIRILQRWCNNKIIFRAEPDFHKYDPKRG